MTYRHSKFKQKTPEPALNRGRKSHRRNLNWLWVSLGALFVVLVGILLIRPGAKPVEITPAQAYAKYQQGAFFVDVRSQEEWDQFHIEKSTLIPLDQLQSRLSEIPKDQDIVVVCLSGHRALSGTAILQQAGFPHVSCLSGGLQAWKDANYPIEIGTP
jgi:rhodanese-related sulfurtransferase